MAEAFAVVSSGVSLSSFAIQLIDSAIKLRSLWSDVKDASEEISNLVHEIEIYGRIFGTIKAVYTPMPSNATFEEIISQCCSLCEQGAQDLESVAKDLETLIMKKRTTGALKIVLKKDVVAKYRSRLECAKTSLLLAQQTYMSTQQAYHTSLHIKQLQKADAIVVTQERLLSQPLQLIDQPHTSCYSQPSSVREPPGRRESAIDTIPANLTGPFPLRTLERRNRTLVMSSNFGGNAFPDILIAAHLGDASKVRFFKGKIDTGATLCLIAEDVVANRFGLERIDANR